MYLERKDPVGARRILAEAPAGAERDAGADWLSGSILMLGGETAEGIAMLEQSAAGAPGNVEIHLDLANAYLMAGRRDDALKTLQAMPPGAGGLRRRQLLVLAEVSGKDAASARQAVLKLAKESPDDVALKVVGVLPFAANDDAARGSFVMRHGTPRCGRIAGTRRGGSAGWQSGRRRGRFKGVIAIERRTSAHIGLAAVAPASRTAGGLNGSSRRSA